MNIENELIDTESNAADFGLSGTAQGYLEETRKWSNFLSIIGFIGLFFILIAGLAVLANKSTFMRGEQALIMGIAYLVMAVVYFFPLLYLSKFSSSMKKALLQKSNMGLEDAFLHLKSHYKFLGIFTIVIISMYILGIAVAIAFQGSGRF